MTRTATFLLGDLRRVARDPLLLGLGVIPLVMALALRFGLPLLAEALAEYVILADYHPVVMAYLPVIAPSLYGMIYGFLVLDERDEHLLQAFAVSPLGRGGYLAMRIMGPTLVGTLVSYGALHLAGLVPVPSLRAIPVCLVGALEAPLIALFLGAFAANKVQGMALGKLSGVFFIAPAVAVLVTSPLRWLASILPAFWVAEAYVRAAEGGIGYWLAVVGGLTVHGVWIGFMYNWFVRRAR